MDSARTNSVEVESLQEDQQDSDTTGLYNVPKRTAHPNQPTDLEAEDRKPYLCGAPKKLVIRTSVCVMSVGLALIAIAIMVLVFSLNTKYWEDTPLHDFAVFILVCGVLFAMGAAIILVRTASAWRQNQSTRRMRRMSTVSTVSDHALRGSTYTLLESFPPIDQRTLGSNNFIDSFFRKMGQQKNGKYAAVPSQDA